MTPYVFRPFAGCARSVAVGHRVYVEGDLLLAEPTYVAQVAAGYGGPEAFDRLTPRQVKGLARAVGYEGPDLITHLLGLPQAALNEARDQVRGIGDEPAPEPEPAAPPPSEAAGTSPSRGRRR